LLPEVQSAILFDMILKALFRVEVAVVLATLALPVTALADDSAVAIAAGGLIPRRETRIIMAKEILRISEKKVVVDYDFRNDSAEDVTTEVAFPVPPYKNGVVQGPTMEEQSFQSFKLLVEGKPVHYESETTATLNGKDVTAILKANQIDIPTFGHFEDRVNTKNEEEIYTHDFSRLSKSMREQLVQAGLFQSFDNTWGLWTVHLQYHWTQTFPAHATVHIRHEYTPVVGYTPMPVKALQFALNPGSARKDAKRWKDSEAEDILSFCPEPELLRSMFGKISQNTNNSYEGRYFPTQWIDFILTSANTWQRPIEDFTLIIERPKAEQDRKTLVSFCSPMNGTVEKLDADHFQVHLTNLVPTSELHIGFFEVLVVKPGLTASKK
jgi:hypothetical protein